MKKILCFILLSAMLLSLCSCGNNTVTSSDVDVIYEEEVIYEGDVSQKDDTLLNEESIASTPDNSSVATETPSPSNSTTTSTPEVEENIYYLNNAQTLNNVKLNGRCEKTAEGVELSLSASAIEFNTDSTSVLMTIDATNGLYYTIMVDGKITVQHQLIEQGGSSYIIVARGLSNGTHNIKFIRDSESRTNLKFTAISIQLDEGASLLAKDSDKPVIEFLGDSLTSGYGNMVDYDVENSSALEYLSSTKAYPFLLANKLDYDYRIVSMSGIALAKREGYPAFTEFYWLESYHLDRVSKKYTSSSPKDVDIVVVNLGTNDIGEKMYDVNSAKSVSEYKEHFTNLITDIGYRKDAKIVFVTGVWHKEPITAITQAMTELKALGYTNVYSVEFAQGRSGGGAHPSSAEHRDYADTLEKFFKENGII